MSRPGPVDADTDQRRSPSEDVEWRLRAWAECVQRLIAIAPTSAVRNETGVGFSGGGHSTPPERKAIRKAARQVVDDWLARDLHVLSELMVVRLDSDDAEA